MRADRQRLSARRVRGRHARPRIHRQAVLWFDADVIAAFQSMGPDWRARISDVLSAWALAQNALPGERVKAHPVG